MKIILPLFFVLLTASFAHAGEPNCMTSDGMKFSAIQDSPRDALCNADYLVINGIKISGKTSNECSELSSFEASDGTKLSIASNGLGTLFYKGKIVSVNCNGR